MTAALLLIILLKGFPNETVQNVQIQIEAPFLGHGCSDSFPKHRRSIDGDAGRYSPLGDDVLLPANRLQVGSHNQSGETQTDLRQCRVP